MLSWTYTREDNVDAVKLLRRHILSFGVFVLVFSYIYTHSFHIINFKRFSLYRIRNSLVDSSYTVQARNNARIMITGSLDMFSNRYVSLNPQDVSSNYSCFEFFNMCNSGSSNQVCRVLRIQKSKFNSYMLSSFMCGWGSIVLFSFCFKMIMHYSALF